MAFNPNPPRVEYVATAGQTTFDFIFAFYEPDDIAVFITHNDIVSELVLTTDFNVTVGSDDGGTVTLTTPTTAGDLIVIVRQLDIVRNIEYQENGDLLASVLNKDQDYQTYLLQDLLGIIDRGLSAPVGSVGSNFTLPSPIPNGFLKWSNDSSELVSDNTSYSTTNHNHDAFYAPIGADNTASNETSHADVVVYADVLTPITSTNKIVTQADVSSGGQTDVLVDSDTLSPVTPTNLLMTQVDVASLGGGDMLASVYDINASGVVDDAELVNGLTVETAVPANMRFIPDTGGSYNKTGVYWGHIGGGNPTTAPDGGSLQAGDMYYRNVGLSDGLYIRTNQNTWDEIKTWADISGNFAFTPITSTNKIITQAEMTNTGDMLSSVYDVNVSGVVDNAELVNGLTVETAVPVGAVFTDTTYTNLSELSNDTNYAPTDSVNVFTQAQRTAIEVLTYSASIAINLENANNFSLTLTGNTTLANPTNQGTNNIQGGLLRITQDATGGRNVTWTTSWKLVGDDNTVTTANTTNVYHYTLIDTDVILYQHVTSY